MKEVQEVVIIRVSLTICCFLFSFWKVIYYSSGFFSESRNRKKEER